MSDHFERLRRIADYTHHRERAENERRLASRAWCLASRAAHIALAELHEEAARERAEDWHPVPEGAAWTPLRLRRAENLLESF